MVSQLDFRIRLRRGQSFHLDAEESVPLSGVTALVGPSGSGKTTLLRALAGLDLQGGGERRVSFAGRDWDAPGVCVPPEDRLVGFVFQEPRLFPHLNVENNLNYGAKRRKVGSFDAIVEALDLGGFLDRDINGLSGGEARRVALGRALASNPAILFLDEPMAGLDAARKAEFLPYVARAVSQARVPALYVSHAGDEIVALADRVLEITAGHLTGWRTPPMRLLARVTTEMANGVEVRLLGAEDAELDGRFVLPMRAMPDELVGLGLAPESIHLSSNHPGEGSALTVLPAVHFPGEGAGGRAVLEVVGQRMTLPARLRVPDSKELWLSILRVLPRPEPNDSVV